MKAVATKDGKFYKNDQRKIIKRKQTELDTLEKLLWLKPCQIKHTNNFKKKKDHLNTTQVQKLSYSEYSFPKEPKEGLRYNKILIKNVEWKPK